MMWNISVIILGIAISLTLVHGGSTEEDIKLAAESNQIFSRDFFAEVGSESTGNLVCSPLSAQLALAMTRLGAKGTTKYELTEKLGLGQIENDNKNAFTALRRELMSENEDGTILCIASRMYASRDLRLENAFKKSAREIFGAEPSTVNFENPSTRLRINEWVKSVTQDKIKDLIQEDSFGENTQLVLVNALYFKGLWKYAFDRTYTSEKTFYSNNQQEVKTTFMFREGNFKMRRSYPDLNASVLELPYKGDSLSFVIVMPLREEIRRRGEILGTRHQSNQNNEASRDTPSMTLSDLEEKMRTLKLGDLLNEARKVDELNVYLPKFTMELALELEDPLKKMGISEIFGRRADLSGISNASNLVISKVAQKSFIEITEEGTEGSAATYPVFTSLSANSGPPRFEVNRPFLFYLIHRTSSNIPPIVLFSGRYVTPPSKP